MKLIFLQDVEEQGLRGSSLLRSSPALFFTNIVMIPSKKNCESTKALFLKVHPM